MGRQNARLWHEGKDHKDFFGVTDIDNVLSVLTYHWRMHWRIYKGDRLLWEKLPPNILTCEDAEMYESVSGKKFSWLGVMATYENYYEIWKIGRFCKVKNFLFGAGEKIIYTENCYLWKELKLNNLKNDEYVLSIANYNERLAILTTYRVIVYDCEKNELNDIYSFTERLSTPVYPSQTSRSIACIGETMIVKKGFPMASRNRGIVIFKNDKAVKEFNGGRVSVVAENGNIFIAEAVAGVLANNNANILSSKDGIVWDTISEEYSVDFIFSHNKKFFLSTRDNKHLFTYKDGKIIKVENNVNAIVSVNSTFLDGFFFFSAGEYMYCNSRDGGMIRFKDFESSEYEVVCKKNQTAGIFLEDWRN